MKRSRIYPPMIWAICCLFTAALFRVIQTANQMENVTVAPPQGAPGAPPPDPADPPVRIAIPSTGITAPVDPVGLNPDGTMQVPSDFARTGWYTGLEVPGAAAGTGIIVGHFDSKEGPAIFYELGKVNPGDEISLTLQSGEIKTFVVEREKRFPKSQFPSIDVYAPSSRPVLRLVTCGGEFDRKSRHYRDNVVVYASAKDR